MLYFVLKFLLTFFRERNIDVRVKHGPGTSCMPPTGDHAHNLGLCPDGESNWQPLCEQVDAQPTELYLYFNVVEIIIRGIDTYLSF